jgi:capsular polysaccharide biosynthesis protein
VNDPDQTITWYRSKELSSRPWADDPPSDEEEPSTTGFAGGLVDLGFFIAALRRRAWVWVLTAIVGLAIGSGLYVSFPPAHHATASVLLVYNPNQDPLVQVQTEASLAQSQAVARQVVQQLKLPQSVSSLQAAYTVTVITDNVLMINVGAPSSASAVQRASALANAYLQYRAQYARLQQQQQFAQLDQQYNQAEQRLKVLEAQINQIPDTPTAQQKAELDNLQTQMAAQKQTIQYVNSTKSSTKTYTNSMVTGSFVLDKATALPQSRIKGAGLDVAGGLFGGLAIGMAIVILSALMSRRLRRRDDIALAMGSPVRLSVGPLRKRRWLSALPKQAAKRKLDMKRVVMYLRGAVPGSSRGPASLAVVAVDAPEVVARIVASLAMTCADEGKRVVLADISGGAYLARLFRETSPGIHSVSRDGAELVLVLPESEEIAPVGPMLAGVVSGTSQADEALVTACSSADLLLTLATLDPAVGGDHLGTWAASAVAVVTAGGSSAEKAHGVSEMIRMADTRLDSVILVGVDKNDESLGVPSPADQAALAKRS